jgi:hypothetical protein
VGSGKVIGLWGRISVFDNDLFESLALQKPKLNVFDPTGWVGLDRYREAMAEIEAGMRELKEQGIKPEEFEGMSIAQIYERLTAVKEQDQ